MKRGKFIAGILIVFTVSTGVMAGAFYKHHATPEKHAQYVVEEISEQLILEQHQVDKLNKLKKELLRVHKGMHGDRESSHLKVESLLSDAIFDQATALRMLGEKTQYLNDNAPGIIAVLGEFYDGLNSEQQALLRAKIQEHKEHHGFFPQH